MDPKATGGFSSEATRPSGRVSYYQPVQPRQAFVPSTEIVRAPSANPDALSASSTYPYYELYGTLPAPPSPLPTAPVPNPVSDPAENVTNSKAMSVGPYGSSFVPLSGSAGYGISATQYAKDTAYFESWSLFPPTPAPAPPDVLAITSTSFTAYFSNAGISGEGTLVYSFLYGLTANETTISVPAVRASPTLSVYTANISGLAANTTYYVRAVVSNVSGAAESGPTQVVTLPAGGTAPTGVVGVPTAVSQTNTSLTVSVNASGITGGSPTVSILYGTTQTPTVPSVTSTFAAGVYTFTVNGLLPSTTYYFQAVASNGVAPDLVSALSAGLTTNANPAPPPALTTNVVAPFLIQGPRFNTDYSQALDYYLNVDAVGCTLAVGDTAIAGTQLYGSLYAGSQVSGGASSNAGIAQADQPYSTTYGTVTDTYFESVGTVSTRRLISWGGFYADIMGLFGPYQPAGFPGTNPAVNDVVSSICNIFLNVSAASNPLTWSRTGWGTNFDGIVLDFENVGLGGNPNVSNTYPLPQSPVPSFPTDALVSPYSFYTAALAGIVTKFYALAPTAFLANAPVSLSINHDLLNGKNNGNIGAANTALNQFFAFQSSSVQPSAATYNNISSGPATQALNHPNQMCYFDDVFVQFYNEDATYYPGGALFPNLLAQWGYVALLAQQKGVKTPRINIGLAKGNIIPGGSPAVASAQGPTPPLDGEAGPPYTYWYPQYCTDSPPNAVSGQSQNWPDTGPTKDPANVAAAITTANSILRQAFGNPNLQPSDWCSGMGFWAGTAATQMANDVYNRANAFSPGAVLPSINTYCWADASYPAPDPDWPGNVPVVVRGT